MMDHIGITLEALRFWAVLLSTAFIKAILSERLGWASMFVTFGVAVFCGAVGTDPVMHWFEIDPVYRDFVLVGVGLTGEQVMRAIILASSDPEFIKGIIRNRFGGGKSDD